jgi:hypothetical protein
VTSNPGFEILDLTYSRARHAKPNCRQPNDADDTPEAREQAQIPGKHFLTVTTRRNFKGVSIVWRMGLERREME